MQDLTPVGLSQDGKRLILVSSRGVEFSVAVDQSFRDALRGDQSRLGQLEMSMESTLRPRDIQARIRSGETAEAVASAANTNIEKIMTYAGPVLAERAHIAQSAQLASIRRKNADSSVSARTLTDAAPPYFREIGMRPDEVNWDAWRRDDGRWTVIAEYVGDDKPQRAEFTYDAPGRYVTADNEQARRLTGEARTAGATPERSSGRRLSAVPDENQLPLGHDLGHDLGDDALEMVREGTALTADHADADWIAPEQTDQDPAPGDEPGDEQSDELTTEIPVDGPLDGAESQAAPEPEPKPKKRGRAQVPSWDEIMFGGGRPE